MTYLYIDESGDLGFNDKGSKYFIITCVKIDEEKKHNEYRRIPKQIRQRVLSKKYKKLSELKFSNSSILIREQFLKRVAKLEIEIYSLIIKKEYTQKKLQDNLPILYNYLIKVLLEQPLSKLKDHDEINICLDNCMSNTQKENFETYIKTEFLSIFKDIPKINISHEFSLHNDGLQVVDFICGAFGYKYNTAKLKDDFESYTNFISSRIKLEKNDLFKKK